MNDPTNLFLGAGIGVMLLAVVIGLFIAIFPFWMISSKAGYSGAISLLLLIPLVGWLLIFYLALAEWPIQRRVRELEARAYQPPQQPTNRPY